MNHMEISIKGNGGASESEIEAGERRMGSAYPPEFREFLMKYNGGEPESNVFDIPGGRTRGSVRAFYGMFGGSGTYDLFAEQRLLKGRLPQGVIIVAEDSCGNGICLSLRKQDFGNVFFWDHEMESKTDVEAALLRVAPTFADFLSILRRFDPKSVASADRPKILRMNPEFAKRFKLKPPE
jgi:hypothetical protein